MKYSVERAQVADANVLKRLLKLDAWGNPGVSRAAFKQMFTMCRRCTKCLARNAFRRHICKAAVKSRPKAYIDLTYDVPREVIDLTGDSEPETMEADEEIIDVV